MTKALHNAFHACAWFDLAPTMASNRAIAVSSITLASCCMQVAQGQTWQGGMQQLPGQLTVEDLVAMVQRLPPGVSAIPTVAQGLHSLDSRACAALLKDLSKNGLPHHALTIFDWLQSLPSENELSGLCDVFTYTTGMTHLLALLQPSKHHRPCCTTYL